MPKIIFTRIFSFVVAAALRGVIEGISSASSASEPLSFNIIAIWLISFFDDVYNVQGSFYKIVSF